jgi:hypothetical protein
MNNISAMMAYEVIPLAVGPRSGRRLIDADGRFVIRANITPPCQPEIYMPGANRVDIASTADVAAGWFRFVANEKDPIVHERGQVALLH